MEIIYLTADTVIELNRELIVAHTPKEPIGVISRDGLESALQRGAVALYYGQCEDIYLAAAAIGWGIVKAHAFANANKRTAAHVVEMFLLLNGYIVEYIDSEAVEVYKGMAKGSVSQDQFADWLRRNGQEHDLY